MIHDLAAVVAADLSKLHSFEYSGTGPQGHGAEDAHQVLALQRLGSRRGVLRVLPEPAVHPDQTNGEDHRVGGEQVCQYDVLLVQ